jgi:hypothetical protein
MSATSQRPILTVATERQFIAASRLTATPGCAACLAPGTATSHVDELNICERCAKAGQYLRAAVEAPDALCKLADELEDALSERHEPTAIARLARLIHALTEQLEAVVEVTDGMASRKSSIVPANYPSGGFGLFGRGVWKAPWMGRNGELVLVAVDATHRMVGKPALLPLGSDYIAMVDDLWNALERSEHRKQPTFAR